MVKQKMKKKTETFPILYLTSMHKWSHERQKPVSFVACEIDVKRWGDNNSACQIADQRFGPPAIRRGNK